MISFFTSEGSDRKSLLLQFRIIVLEFFYRIKFIILKTFGFKYSAISPSANFLNDLIMLTNIMYSN